MPKTADRVLETSTTTGTGALTLAGAVSSHRTFSSQFAAGVPFYYCIQMGADFEIGVGTLVTGTLSRDSVLSSSNAGALVSWLPGTKAVFCCLPDAARRTAAYAIYLSGVI